MGLHLLSDSNTKTIKGERNGYATFMLSLLPSDLVGIGNTCPKATPGCRAACLNTAGHGGMFQPGETLEVNNNIVQWARRRKTTWFFQDRSTFLTRLAQDIRFAVKKATKKGLTPVFRLNGTSDISWEKYAVDDAKNIFALFPDLQFYDYTKVLGRKATKISNYHLTFSAADGNDADVQKAIKQGYNIAAVFDKVPKSYWNLNVIDGDENDLRFKDPSNSVVGLKAKGRAKKDTTGFLIRLKEVV